MALVKDAKIAARTSKFLESGEVATSTCFGDQGLPSALSLGFASDSPFLDLPPSKTELGRHFCCQQIHIGLDKSTAVMSARQALKCVQQAKGLETAGLGAVGVSMWSVLKTAGGGSGSQSLCSQQQDQAPKIS